MFLFHYCQDCVHVNGVQSDSGDKEQVLTVTGGCQTFENEAVQIPAVFTSVEVKCEVEVSCFFLCFVVLPVTYHCNSIIPCLRILF